MKMKLMLGLLFTALLLMSLPVRAQGHSATLSFTASVTPGVTGYNMYRAPCTGTITANVCSAAGTPVKLNSSPFTALTYVDNTVVAGSLYDYYATAVCPVCSPTESVPSNHYAVTIPKDVPQPPGNLTVTSVTRNSTGSNTSVVAKWTDAPNVTTTYRLVDSFGSVVATGTAVNPQGSYSLSWSGKVKPNTAMTFTVCDETGDCNVSRI